MKRFVLDLRKAEKGDPTSGWLREGVQHRMIGARATKWGFHRATVTDAYDVMVYFEKSTPSQLLDQ